MPCEREVSKKTRNYYQNYIRQLKESPRRTNVSKVSVSYFQRELVLMNVVIVFAASYSLMVHSPPDSVSPAQFE